MLHRLLPASILVAAVATPVAAQCPDFLTGPLSASSQFLGSSIAMDGPRAAIGSPRTSASGLGDGAVFVFERSGSEWIEQAQLSIPTTNTFASFGTAVALEGDLLVGSAPFYAGATWGGGAWVFERVGGSWQLAAALLPASLASGDRLGDAVAVAGDRALVSSLLHVNAAGDLGAVWEFARGPAGWQEVQEITPPYGTSRIGSSLAVSGDTLLVGTVGDGVLVYERQGSSWAWVEQLTAPQPWYLSFGRSVALDGDRALIGAPLQMPGAAFVFERIAGTWYSRAKLQAHDGLFPGARFGSSVALDGARALVGAPERHLYGKSDMGTAYLFQERDGQWSHSLQLFDPTPTSENSGFGTAVGVQGPALLVGTPRDTAPGHDAGSVEAFTLPDSAFTICFCFGDSPCANPRPMAGCKNSTGAGALLSPCGTDGALADDLVFTAEGLPPGQPALLFAGTNEIELPFGDGLLCAGGAVVRLGTASADSSGRVLYGPDLADAGGFTPGEVRLFQAWYRDPQGPCGSGFNTSSGIGLRYGP